MRTLCKVSGIITLELQLKAVKLIYAQVIELALGIFERAIMLSFTYVLKDFGSEIPALQDNLHYIRCLKIDRYRNPMWFFQVTNGQPMVI